MSRYFRALSLTALLSVLKMFSGFAIAKAIAVLYGPSGIAIVGQLQSFLNIVNGVVNAPVGTSVVRYTSENDGDLKKVIPWWRASVRISIFLYFIVFSFVVVTFSYVSELIFYESNYAWMLLLAIILVPFSAFNMLVVSIVNGHQKYKLFFLLGAGNVLLNLLTFGGLAYFYGLKGVLLSVIFSYTLVTLISILFVRRESWFSIKNFLGKVRRKNIRGVSKYVLMALTSAVLGPLSLVLIRTFIEKELSLVDVGLWQASWKISEAYLSIGLMALTTVVLPRLIKLGSYEEIKRQVVQSTRLVIPLIVLVAVAIFLLRDLIISLLFSSDFSGARELFVYQLSGDVLKMLCWFYSFPMLAHGKVYWYIGTSFGYSFMFVVGSYLLIPIFGLQGVPLTYALSYLFFFIFLLINFRSIAGIKHEP